MNDGIDGRLREVFAVFPETLYGYTDISYSLLSHDFQSALVIAMPHIECITLEEYTEEKFERILVKTKEKMEALLEKVEAVLKENHIRYYIPPNAQQDERELMAVFSYKYAAVNAGLGWIGKNDMLVTNSYGPRVRLAAVLIDRPFEYGTAIAWSCCPKECTKCVDECPHKALTGALWDINLPREKVIDYHLCNEKRSMYIKTHGRKHACGLCMAACPLGMLISPK